MGQSLSSRFDEPAGSFTHKPSGAVVTIQRQGNSLRQRVDEHGLTAYYQAAYSIGYGKVGRSYLIDLNGHLFQSPASFYTRQGEWGASPGYENSPLLDFSRSIDSACLVCHAGSVQRDALQVRLTPLTCDRCHGDPTSHLKAPLPGSIVNPAKLAVRERDSVCEQCHLEGAATVLNPGKSTADFHPGLRLESVESHYVLRTASGELASAAAVSHAEQLASSACARVSAGKLWCGTCHDPHGPGNDMPNHFRQVCRSCHSQTQLASTHTTGQDDCVGCHMPARSASDISHAAITDHRIRKRPAESIPQSGPQLLSAWQDVSPEYAARNLGLAYFHVARETQSADSFRQASVLLSQQHDPSDAEALAALAYLLLGSGRTSDAVRLFASATELKPADAEYWLDLAVAQENAQQTTQAIQSFERSIGLNPYDYRPYRGLSALYVKLQQPAQSRDVTARFLKLVPQSLTVRLQP